MTLQNIKSILSGITGFADKVAYRAFNVGAAPDLPFICYRCIETNNFKSDSRVYKVIQEIAIELYTDEKDPETESLVEEALNNAGLTWDKDEIYIDSENCYMITYGVSFIYE